MPSAKALSPEDIREIVAARGKLAAKEIQKKFGIGTTRLYKIWREAGVFDGKTSKPAKTAKTSPATTNNQQQPLLPPTFFEESAARPATPAETEKKWQDVLLPQILAGVQDLQNNMALLLETQESHYEDVEDIGKGLQGLEAEVEETGEGILESIERNSNAVRAETDKIVGAANAAGSAALGVVQVLGYAMGLAAFALLLYPKLRQKYEERKQQNAASEELANPPQQPQKSANKKGIRAME